MFEWLSEIRDKFARRRNLSPADDGFEFDEKTKADITAEDVQPVMEAVIEHQALLVGTSVAASVKGAVIREVTETVLI